MNEIYRPGAKTPAEKAAEEAEKKNLRTAEQIQEILEQTKTLEPGLRILCMEAPIKKTLGKVILPGDDEALQKMGCKRFMVLKPSRDVPSDMKNADWFLQAAQADSVMPMELEVRKVEFGDYVWAPPFAASKIPVVTSRQILTVEVINWGDVIAIQEKEQES